MEILMLNNSYSYEISKFTIKLRLKKYVLVSVLEMIHKTKKNIQNFQFEKGINTTNITLFNVI